MSVAISAATSGLACLTGVSIWAASGVAGRLLSGGIEAASKSRDQGGVVGVLRHFVETDCDRQRGSLFEHVGPGGVVACDGGCVRFAVVPVEECEVPCDRADERIAEVEDTSERSAAADEEVFAVEVRVDDADCTSAGSFDVACKRGGDTCDVGGLFGDWMIVDRRAIERPDSGMEPSISNPVDAIHGQSPHQLLLVVGQGPEPLGRHVVKVRKDVGKLATEVVRPDPVVRNRDARDLSCNGARGSVVVDERPVGNWVAERGEVAADRCLRSVGDPPARILDWDSNNPSFPASLSGPG